MAQVAKPRRSIVFFAATAVLGAISLIFFYRQNFTGQIGGGISVAKLLWLDYAILAWFILPFFFWKSPLVLPELRRIYGWHLLNFSLRGLIELWMMYVTVSWSPPYGIAHDLFSIAILSWLARAQPRCHDPINRSAQRFLISIRLTLLCEIAFAWLFYRAAWSDTGVYFVSGDPAFAFINGITWAVVLLAYPDLVRTIWGAREALFPAPTTHHTAEECHA